jgi:hypothetical protein
VASFQFATNFRHHWVPAQKFMWMETVQNFSETLLKGRLESKGEELLCWNRADKGHDSWMGVVRHWQVFSSLHNHTWTDSGAHWASHPVDTTRNGTVAWSWSQLHIVSRSKCAVFSVHAPYTPSRRGAWERRVLPPLPTAGEREVKAKGKRWIRLLVISLRSVTKRLDLSLPHDES